MKAAYQFTPEELTDLVASVLASNGHDATGNLVLYNDGKPVEFDEARIEVGAQLTVRCAPEQSEYDKMRARYAQSIGQFGFPLPEEPGNAEPTQENP